MDADEAVRKIQIQIVEDKIVEPDEDFFIDLLHEDTLKRLDGEDTSCRVVITEKQSDLSVLGFS